MSSVAAPLFSVCVPSYKSEEFIRRTVDSVRKQSFTDWELIVTDDASPDDTWAELQAISSSAEDPRLKFSRNPERLGMVGNWNYAVSRASGTYIKLLCSDDYLVPDALEREIAAFQTHPNAVVVASPRQVVNSAGKPLFVRSGIEPGSVLPGRSAIRHTILSGTNAIGDPVVVSFRADAFSRAGGFDPRAVYCTDLDMWVRLLLQGDLVYLDRPTGCYRLRKAATGPSVRHLTVSDYVAMSKRISALGNLGFTRAELEIVRAKSWFLNLVRQFIYRRWAGG